MKSNGGVHHCLKYGPVWYMVAIYYWITRLSTYYTFNNRRLSNNIFKSKVSSLVSGAVVDVNIVMGDHSKHIDPCLRLVELAVRKWIPEKPNNNLPIAKIA